jgi:hypothetical protein
MIYYLFLPAVVAAFASIVLFFVLKRTGALTLIAPATWSIVLGVIGFVLEPLTVISGVMGYVDLSPPDPALVAMFDYSNVVPKSPVTNPEYIYFVLLSGFVLACFVLGFLFGWKEKAGNPRAVKGYNICRVGLALNALFCILLSAPSLLRLLGTGVGMVLYIPFIVIAVLILAVIVWICVMSVKDFITFFRNKK